MENNNNQLIKISTNENGAQAVSARDLYVFLESKERFSKWFSKILDYDFIDGEDYTPYQTVHPQNWQQMTDYAMTLDMAKEAAMLSKLQKGKQARQYFIDCEKQLKAVKQISMTMTEIVAYNANNLVKLENEQKELRRKQKEIEAAQLAQKQQINKIEAKVTDINTDYYTIAGYASLRGANIDASYANLLGRKAAKLSRQFSVDINKVHSTIFGTVNSYHVDILKQVFKNIK